jgi:hypothetical protein
MWFWNWLPVYDWLIQDKRVIVVYSNMKSFIGYINNTRIKLVIYFNSHIRIDEQIM